MSSWWRGGDGTPGGGESGTPRERASLLRSPAADDEDSGSSVSALGFGGNFDPLAPPPGAPPPANFNPMAAGGAWRSDPMQAPWLQVGAQDGGCGAGCEGGHGVGPPAQRRCGNESRLVAVLLLNLGYTLAELACFYFFDSLTMLADAFHNLSDVLAVGIALQCERMKRRPDSASAAYHLRHMCLSMGNLDAR
jgi:hypothetical protein